MLLHSLFSFIALFGLGVALSTQPAPAANLQAVAGVEVTLESTIEFFASLSGGSRRGAAAAGLLSLQLDASLSELANWHGAHLHASLFLPQGANLSECCTGDFGGVSNIAFTNSPRLFELWLEQRWLDGRLSLRAGVLAFDEEFATTDSAAYFINGGFGPSVAITANMPVPVYAIAAPGVRLAATPIQTELHEVTVLAAVFDGNPAPGALPDLTPGAAFSTESNHFGTHWALRPDEGALFAFEVAWSRKAASGDEIPGTLMKGGMVWHTDRFADRQDPLRSDTGNHAIYGLIEQELWSSPDRSERRLAAFARGTWAPDRWNAIQFAGEAGLVLRAPFPERDGDALALGFAHFRSSHRGRRAEREAGESPTGHETVLELTYHYRATSWLVIQPDAQVIFSPGGSAGTAAAFVAGLRVSASF